MIESDTRPWIKLWARWYESTSHALLSPQALHTGPHLLVLAAKYGRREDGSAELVGPTGDPLSLGDLSRLTRWPPKAMGKLVRELEAAGTLEKRGSVYVFPRFGSYQESKSLARVRRHRQRKGNADEDVTVTPSVTTEQRQRTEDREQKTEDRETPVAPTGAPSADERREARATELWHRYETARHKALAGRQRKPEAKKLRKAALQIVALVRYVRGTEGLEEEPAWARVEAYAFGSIEEAARGDPKLAGWRGDWQEWRTTRFDRWASQSTRIRSLRGPVDPATQDHSAPKVF